MAIGKPDPWEQVEKKLEKLRAENERLQGELNEARKQHQRLEEMDYALVAGNTLDEMIPRSALRGWLRYVFTGNRGKE